MSAAMKRKPHSIRPRIQSFVLKDLHRHPRIQREFDEGWARKIEERFDMAGFGYPCIIHAPGKPYHWVFDGQHRVEAAKKVLGPDARVTCAVYEEGLSDMELAQICERLNNNKAWRAIDDFRNRVTAGDAGAVEINKIIQKRGLKVGNAPTPGVIRAISSVEWVYKKLSAMMLDRTLGILFSAWGDQYEALDANFIRGLAMFLAKFGDEIDEQHLLRRLQASAGPVRILRDARDYSRLVHMTPSRAVVQILTAEYNKRLKGSNRLGHDEEAA